MISKALFTLVTVALVGANASGENWVQIGSTKQGVKVFLNIDSVRDVGPHRAFWQKTISSSSKESYRLEQWFIDCVDRKQSPRSVILYFPNGSNESYEWREYETQWRSIVPDSIGDTLYRIVCYTRQQ